MDNSQTRTSYLKVHFGSILQQRSGDTSGGISELLHLESKGAGVSILLYSSVIRGSKFLGGGHTSPGTSLSISAG